jgi:NADH-quinone oxidoreductase subunit G
MIDQVPVNDPQPLELRAPADADFVPAVKDFYLTNPIARASALMAELSAAAKARSEAAIAAE